MQYIVCVVYTKNSDDTLSLGMSQEISKKRNESINLWISISTFASARMVGKREASEPSHCDNQKITNTHQHQLLLLLEALVALTTFPAGQVE